MIVLNFLYQNN